MELRGLASLQSRPLLIGLAIFVAGTGTYSLVGWLMTGQWEVGGWGISGAFAVCGAMQARKRSLPPDGG